MPNYIMMTINSLSPRVPLEIEFRLEMSEFRSDFEFDLEY